MNARENSNEASEGKAMSNVDDNGRRISEIAEEIHALEFARRLLSLTDEQLDHMDVTRFSEAQRVHLDALPTKDRKDMYIEQLARSAYIAKCLWIDYLNGVIDEPPIGEVDHE